MVKVKPFCISKREVWDAYKRVRLNHGAAGVDEVSIAEFEEDLENNLYKLWNRMSSGSYFPPPVRRVEISKDDGRLRPLGIPTVADRIAQTVVKHRLEPELEGIFHDNSFGYRPGKSAIEAVGVSRKRCWKRDWVVDLDIKGFFDNLDHGLLMKAVRKHTKCRWMLLYIERWLKAPAQLEDGTLEGRDKGTPQGGVISPLLANLFLHYGFDKWMERELPTIPFERYADDIICHCITKRQARFLLSAIEQRLSECRLELNSKKTRIVYCKDSRRRGESANDSFDFLGFTFRPRRAKSRLGKCFVSFIPGISAKAAKGIRTEMRSWRIPRGTDKSLEDLSRMVNPMFQGWNNYYGSYCKSALYPIYKCYDRMLVKWATRKYKRFKGGKRCARRWLKAVRRREPYLFAHWQLSPSLG